MLFIPWKLWSPKIWSVRLNSLLKPKTAPPIPNQTDRPARRAPPPPPPPQANKDEVADLRATKEEHGPSDAEAGPAANAAPRGPSEARAAAARRAAKPKRTPSEAVADLRATMARIRALAAAKLDAATAHFVEHHDRHTNRKDSTCQLAVALPGVQLGVWVNVAKNLRLKLIEHPAVGVATDVPRPIILQLVGLRCLHLRHDPLSPADPADLFTVGGVLFVELVDVPERPRAVRARAPDVKDAGAWAMLRLTERSGALARQPYPAVDPITGQLQQSPPMQAARPPARPPFRPPRRAAPRGAVGRCARDLVPTSTGSADPIGLGPARVLIRAWGLRTGPGIFGAREREEGRGKGWESRRWERGRN
jgi:hypothetical protein